MEWLFWLSVAVVLYPYLVYPAILLLRTRLRGEAAGREGSRPIGAASVIVTAHNEKATIAARVAELAGLLQDAAGGEVIVVSDGSTDGTAEVARGAGGSDVVVIELPENGGKAVALNQGAAAARNEILVLADARQRWAPDALERLLENFADPEVGAVSGELVLEDDQGVMAGVGLYWRFEKWIRSQESRLHATVGVTGAICAVRRELFRPIPPGTILDDVYWPLRVAMQGYRVVYDRRAWAFDRLPERTQDEFRRKVRTLSGNFQLLTRLPAAVLPWKNPVAWQFVSHKLLRLVVPWALLGLLVASAVLPGLFYQAAFFAQLAFYLIAIVGLFRGPVQRLPMVSTASSFLVLNAAAWVAFWVWATGRASRSWVKVDYEAGKAPDGRDRAEISAGTQ